MSNKSDISAELNLDISGYSSNISRAIRDSDSLDSALADLIASSNKAESALNDINGDVSVDVDADYHSLLEADDLVDKLDSQSATVNVDTDSSDAKDEIEDIRGKLANLQTLGILNLAVNLAGKIPGPSDIPLLGAIVEADDAARSLVASLGELGQANAAQYVGESRQVFTGGFGEDRQEAAEAYATTVQLTKDETGKLATTGENFGTITERAFTTAKIAGENYNAVLAAADTLVQTGITPTYEEAFDVITTGYQNGLNKGGQFLDTIKESGAAFGELRFKGGDLLTFLQQGLEGGAKDTAQLGELVLELNTKLKSAMSGKGAEFDAFKALGLRDEVKAVQAGEMTGVQFAGALFTAIEDNSQKKNIQELVSTALGSKAEELTIPVLIDIDPTQIDSELASYTGATLDAQIQLQGGLGESWQILQRTIETDLATSVSDAFDIPGKINQFNEGVRKFSEEIRNGATIPQAIEVAFQIPGFADTAAGLESALGNLGIVLLQVAASILDAIGQGGAAESVRGTVAEAGAAQLAFDLKINAGNQEAIASTIQTAIDRGVDTSKITTGITTAGQELISQGELDKAQTLIDATRSLSGVTMPWSVMTFLSGEGIDVTNFDAVKTRLEEIEGSFTSIGNLSIGTVGGMSALDVASTIESIDTAEPARKAVAPLTEAFESAKAEIQGKLDTTSAIITNRLSDIESAATENIQPVTESTDALSTAFTAAGTAFTLLNTNVATNIGVISTTLMTGVMDIDSFSGNTVDRIQGDVPSAFEHAGQTVIQFGYDLGGTMRQAVSDVDDFIRKFLSINNMEVTVPTPQVGGGGGTPPGSQGHAAGGVIMPGSVDTVHGGEQLVYGAGQDVAVLNRQTSSAIEAAIAQYAAGMGAMGGGGNTTVNNYVNMTFNTSGAAATSAALNSTQIRGF